MEEGAIENKANDSDDEVELIDDNEKTEGEHVGFDGESERSEDEEMNDEDRAFLDDAEEEPNKNMSYHAFLNAKRYEDDDKNLKR